MDRPALTSILAPGLAAGAAAAGTAAVSDAPLLAAGVAAVAAAAASFFTAASPPAPPGEGGHPGGSDPQAGLPAGAGRHLLDQLSLGVILIDGAGMVRFMNPAAEAFLGRRPPGDFPVAALRAPRLLDGIKSAMETGKTVTAEFVLARAADMHLFARVLPVATGAGGAPPNILVTLEDHSRAHRAAGVHRDFVANASHELKTPLSAISGLVETLQGHARDDPEARERFLDMIAVQAGRMKRLVEDLLSLNRIEINERVRPSEPQPLGDVIAEVVDNLAREAAGAEMAIRTTGADNAPIVPGSREELAQALSNIIENAIRYGRPGTAVEVSVVRDPTAHPRMVGIAVADHGPGIPREHIPRLTERFYRVSATRSREKGGTGLGLAIVKHIANRHRGTLEITSTLGEGSRFTLWLPVSARD